jgi:hypothetical protein
MLVSEIENAQSTVAVSYPKEGDSMLKKLSIALSVIAALGLAVASVPAGAKPQGNKNKSVQVKQVTVKKNFVVKKNVTVKKKGITVKKISGPNKTVYVVGKSYNGHIWMGRKRHFWHNQWWDYGVGRCWILVDGVWFWNPVLCPL